MAYSICRKLKNSQNRFKMNSDWIAPVYVLKLVLFSPLIRVKHCEKKEAGIRYRFAVTLHQVFQMPAWNNQTCTRGDFLSIQSASRIPRMFVRPLAAGTGDARNLLNAIHQRSAHSLSVRRSLAAVSGVRVCVGSNLTAWQAFSASANETGGK